MTCIVFPVVSLRVLTKEVMLMEDTIQLIAAFSTILLLILALCDRKKRK